MAMTFLSVPASQRYNSTPTELTIAETASQSPTLASICDILSIIKHFTNTLSPQNAHFTLKTTYQGLDDASSKLTTFQDGLKRTYSAAIYDSDTPGAFLIVSDTLLDVVREIEVAPEKIVFEGKTKRPLKETWRNLKSFGPIIGERQRQLRRLYISTLNVVVKVLVSLDKQTSCWMSSYQTTRVFRGRFFSSSDHSAISRILIFHKNH